MLNYVQTHVIQEFNYDQVKDILIDQKKFFIKYCEQAWLERYFIMQRMASMVEIGSLTTMYADTPISKQASNKSKVEELTLKKLGAEEWIATFHEVLKKLPEDYQELIELRYLTRGRNGKLYNDDYVYDTLGYSRATYYRLKPKALEMLGMKLYQAEHKKLKEEEKCI
ncbi:hypothetical protein IRY55_07430 [Savagea sp. SN6]|uniref:Uncharacterized protein n=1 Tax=Savagea serpentis TaxID=2785297 RepID=A0A8J7G2W1_9BACL|nr:ArpU family phage packaging/lysis transcriptional regulator [Savagea serpentis]MBF4501190.1 hypothetical protein [Savagea serpentis]